MLSKRVDRLVAQPLSNPAALADGAQQPVLPSPVGDVPGIDALLHPRRNGDVVAPAILDGGG